MHSPLPHPSCLRLRRRSNDPVRRARGWKIRRIARFSSACGQSGDPCAAIHRGKDPAPASEPRRCVPYRRAALQPGPQSPPTRRDALHGRGRIFRRDGIRGIRAAWDGGGGGGRGAANRPHTVVGMPAAGLQQAMPKPTKPCGRTCAAGTAHLCPRQPPRDSAGSGPFAQAIRHRFGSCGAYKGDMPAEYGGRFRCGGRFGRGAGWTCVRQDGRWREVPRRQRPWDTRDGLGRRDGPRCAVRLRATARLGGVSGMTAPCCTPPNTYEKPRIPS